MRISRNPITLANHLLAWRHGSQHVVRSAYANGVSLIHVHHPVTALYSIRAARTLGLPLVLHIHDAEKKMRPLYRLALWRAVRVCDRIICVSADARRLVDEVEGDPRKVITISNGIDPSILDAVRAPAAEVKGPGPHIGIFGVLHPSKGHAIFMAAARLMAQQNSTAHFWVVGPVPYADMMPHYRYIQSLADDPILVGRVTFTGFQTDVARWMQAMDVVVMPSLVAESFGLVAGEAMALGRPVVASRLGALVDLIDDGVTGRLVPPGDADALAQVLGEVLNGQSATLGEKAAAAIRERLSPSAFARHIVDVYDSVLKERSLQDSFR